MKCINLQKVNQINYHLTDYQLELAGINERYSASGS